MFYYSAILKIQALLLFYCYYSLRGCRRKRKVTRFLALISKPISLNAHHVDICLRWRNLQRLDGRKHFMQRSWIMSDVTYSDIISRTNRSLAGPRRLFEQLPLLSSLWSSSQQVARRENNFKRPLHVLIRMCRSCFGTQSITWVGSLHWSHGDIIRYICSDCDLEESRWMIHTRWTWRPTLPRAHISLQNVSWQ